MNPMSRSPQLPPPDPSGLEDITELAAITGLRDAVYLEPAIVGAMELTFAEKQLDGKESLLIHPLAPFSWLARIMPSSTRIVFAVSPDGKERERTIPLVASYYERADGGYYWVISSAPIADGPSHKRPSQTNT